MQEPVITKDELRMREQACRRMKNAYGDVIEVLILDAFTGAVSLYFAKNAVPARKAEAEKFAISLWQEVKSFEMPEETLQMKAILDAALSSVEAINFRLSAR